MDLAAVLAENGFVAPEEEAAELREAARGDRERLSELVKRRLSGEPLAWITGHTVFCGIDVHIDPGVYVPRWHSEPLAERAAERLPAHGTAVDVCTGSGAIAKVLQARRPEARVLATDIDPRAVACARENGVDARRADLLETIDDRLDVVVSVPPYVPTPELALLQRDTFTFESKLAYDGGPDGTKLLRRLAAQAADTLRPGGALILGLGAGQPEQLGLAALKYSDVAVITDENGDVRGVEAIARR